MPAPPTRTVVATYRKSPTEPATGTVTFELVKRYRDADEDVVYPPSRRTVTLSAGQIAIELFCAPLTYKVTERILEVKQLPPRTYLLSVPEGATPFDLADWAGDDETLIPTDDIAMALAGLEERVDALELGGGGGGGGSLPPGGTSADYLRGDGSWAAFPAIPDSPDDIGAASSSSLATEVANRTSGDTALGGLITAEQTARQNADTGLQGQIDGKAASSHQHAADDVTSGQFSISRIPVGTSGLTVAAGNHGHAAADISDLTEATHDIVSSLLVEGSGVTLGYDDEAGTLTIASTGGTGGGLDGEGVRDVMGTALVGTGAISVTPDDPGDTITIATTAYAPGGTDVPIADGGTGASTASTARSNLGLGSVNNTADADKPISTATQTALDAKASTAALTAHTGDTANPHAVTKTQVGLGNVPDVDARARSTHTGTQVASTISDFSAAADARITAQAGQANGLATLDGGGKIPSAQLPNSIMDYKGTWNASTNSPALADGSGSAGDVYRVSVAGTRNLGSGSITFDVGDYAVYNGTTWEKSDTTDSVPTVFGRVGDVVAQSGDYTAAQVTNAPAGGIAATTVQSAINELDAEKAAASHNHAAGDVTSGTFNIARIPTGTSGSTVALGNHGHTAGDVSGLATVATSGAYADLSGKPTIPDSYDDIGAAAVSHTHVVGDTTGLQTALDGKASTSHKSTHWTGGSDALAPSDIGAAPVDHDHNAADVTLGTFNIARIPTGTTGSTVALGNHGHAITDTTGLQTALDTKVESSTINEIWTGTQSAYDGLGSYDSATLYFITG